MMHVDGIAALWFLRHYRERVPSWPRCDFRPCAKRVSEISYRGLMTCGLADKPLSLAVHSDHERICPSAFAYHVFSRGLPRGAFIQADDDLAVASPELCFVEAAHHLSVPELILLGHELTGTYAYIPRGDEGFTASLPQLTTCDKLTRFTKSMAGASGTPKAREALRWIADRSASPRETPLGLRLSLPTRLGGFNLAGLEFNGEVRIGSIAAARIGVESFHCDILYRSENVGIEYQSSSWHLTEGRYARDMQRMNAIQAAGTRIVNVSNRQFQDYQQMDLVARDIAAALGRRFRKPTPDQFARKIDLAKTLSRADRVVKGLDALEDGRWTFEDYAESRGCFSARNWVDDHLSTPEP